MPRPGPWVPWDQGQGLAPVSTAVAAVILLAGAGLIGWGAEAFAEHLGAAAVALRVSTFALAVLLAGAEPESSPPG